MKLDSILTLMYARTERLADLVYLDPPFNTGRKFGEFDDRWDNLAEYLEFLGPVVESAKDCLAYDGNFVLHLDWHAVHYAKVMCDSIFGIDNFQNEVIWRYNSGGASKKRLSRKHDTLLVYSMEPEGCIFNTLREPYATPNVQDRKGFHPDGRLMTDVWDIPFLSTTASERTGYDTQKPVALLERVVSLWSNPGGLVVDPMCGSGTTAVACQNLGRDFIVGDNNETAVQTTSSRLSK